MINHRKNIRDLLLADATVLSKLATATSVYNGLAPIDAARPYVLIRRISRERPKTHDQRNNSSTRKADLCTWSIIAVGENGDDIEVLADAIDNALDGQSASETAVLLFQDATDETDYKQDNSGVIISQINVTFTTRNLPH